MLRGVLKRLVASFRTGEETDEEADDGEAADSWFVPSALDASVRYAHGMRDAEAERQLAAIEEQAERLEALQRDDR